MSGIGGDNVKLFKDKMKEREELGRNDVVRLRWIVENTNCSMYNVANRLMLRQDRALKSIMANLINEYQSLLSEKEFRTLTTENKLGGINSERAGLILKEIRRRLHSDKQNGPRN